MLASCFSLHNNQRKAKASCRGQGSMSSQTSKWIKLDMWWTKTNIDTTTFIDSMVVSVIMSNQNGCFMGGYEILIRNQVNPIVLEVMGPTEPLK